MKLWLIKDDGWDKNFYIVRAIDEVQACDLTQEYSGEITELTTDGSPGLLWSHCDMAPPSEP